MNSSYFGRTSLVLVALLLATCSQQELSKQTHASDEYVIICDYKKYYTILVCYYVFSTIEFGISCLVVSNVDKW